MKRAASPAAATATPSTELAYVALQTSNDSHCQRLFTALAGGADRYACFRGALEYEQVHRVFPDLLLLIQVNLSAYLPGIPASGCICQPWQRTTALAPLAITSRTPLRSKAPRPTFSRLCATSPCSVRALGHARGPTHLNCISSLPRVRRYRQLRLQDIRLPASSGHVRRAGFLVCGCRGRDGGQMPVLPAVCRSQVGSGRSPSCRPPNGVLPQQQPPRPRLPTDSLPTGLAERLFGSGTHDLRPCGNLQRNARR